MRWFWIILVVAYLVGARVVARRYFARSNGASHEMGETGVFGVALVGLVWPASILIESTRIAQRLASDDQDIHIVFLDIFVTSDKRRTFELSLSDWHPVERVAVVRRRAPRRDPMLGRDGEVPE